MVSALKLGSESGLYTSIQPNDKRWFTVETLLSFISCMGLCYSFAFDVLTMKKGFAKTLASCNVSNPHEARFLDTLRAVTELS